MEREKQIAFLRKAVTTPDGRNMLREVMAESLPRPVAETLCSVIGGAVSMDEVEDAMIDGGLDLMLDGVIGAEEMTAIAQWAEVWREVLKKRRGRG